MTTEALGQSKLSFLDKVGQGLSRRPIMDVVRRYERPRVLDIGCGYQASVLVHMAPTLTRGVGIERSVCDEAKRAPGLTFLEGEAEDALASLEPSSFEVVMMISVLEHLWEPLTALERCRALLAPGGTLVVNVPNWAGKVFLEVSAFKLGMSTAESIDDHKTYYWKHQLWPLLVRAGFKPSKIKMRYHKLGLNLFAVARAD